jgi:hypothetical protein
VGLSKYRLKEATTVDKLFRADALSGPRSMRKLGIGELGRESLNPFRATAKSCTVVCNHCSLLRQAPSLKPGVMMSCSEERLLRWVRAASVRGIMASYRLMGL